MYRYVRWLPLFCALVSGPSFALDYEWGELKTSLKTKVSFGSAWRMEDREDRLIGKLNVPGQQNLCAPDDCFSFSGDPEPNQRLVDAKGSFLGHTFDNGNLNYDKGEVVAAAAKVAPDLGLSWRDFQLRARGIGFYDAENDGRRDFHTNTIHQPGYTKRLKRVDRDLARDFDLYEAYGAYGTTLGDRNVSIVVGSQNLRWGESNFIALNTLNEINPPDENRLWLPGGAINEVFQPVPLVKLSTDVMANVSAEAFYQWEWKAVRPAAAGGFLSSFEAAGGAGQVEIHQGQVPEDPDGLHRFAGLAGQISSSSATARFIRGRGEPDDGGQYGLRLSWFAENFNNGTDLGFYAMNYHSRVPYLSGYAGDDSCMRNSTTFVQAAVDCNGFNGSLRNQIATLLPGQINTALPGEEPLPFDSVRLFLDYPEDVHLYGMSFNTNFGPWSLAGEYAYRPNLPVQVALTDVLMTMAQPLFPRQDIPVGIGPIAAATVPGARHFIPDFLSVYRGYDNNDPGNDINAHQLVRGYERMKVDQIDFTGLKTISSSNWIFADQIILLVEAGATHVYDMPDKKDLQFEGMVLHKDTHASPGADGTGLGGVPDSGRLNPTQQTKGFADDFAWGYRILSRFEYNDVFEGVNLKPWIGWFHDVDGIGVAPMQNFIEGRKNFLAGTEFDLEGGWSGQLFYYGFMGGNNVIRDRDFLTFSVSYTF